MSTSTLGAARRSFMSGRRLWPPGQELGFVAVLADEADRLFCRTGPDVIERSGNHLEASLMACQTRCGVAGMVCR